MKNRIRLNESQLNQIIRESVKNVLNETFGVDLDDTLAWVKKKKPSMPPSEQIRFAKNIIKKRASQNNQQPQMQRDPEGLLDGVSVCYGEEYCSQDLLFVVDRNTKTEDPNSIVCVRRNENSNRRKLEELFPFESGYIIWSGTIVDYRNHPSARNKVKMVIYHWS